jgi:hypothetical protein
LPGSVRVIPRALREAMKDQHFAQAQRRRAQTEGRIAIFKNEFLGRPMRAEGLPNKLESTPNARGVSRASGNLRFLDSK